jgi:F-box/leucine-rich repeat protein 10/11
MQARQVTVQWLESDSKAFTEPIFIPRPEGLDMLVLPADIRISEIAAAVGPDKPLDVIDVASQSGLSNWTVGKWASYFEDPGREKVRNVISLELSATPMKDKVASPKVVRDIDWVEQFWPRDLMAKDIYPQVIRYCLMSPALSWTDWHIDFSASSVFYHILRGSKTFYFIRPTASNLAKYEKWSGTSQQLGVWLGDECDEVHKVRFRFWQCRPSKLTSGDTQVELQAGNTLIIPSGWIHCVYTPTDALVIGGNFLHSYNIATQLRVYQIELATKVPKKFRFPYFVTLLWYVGHHYHRQLSKSRHGVCERVLKGLKALSAFLIEQAWRMSEEADVSAERRKVANENVPWQVVDDPEALAAELQKAVYKALGEDLPMTPLDGKPTFDARDFLDVDEVNGTSNGSSLNNKRKAGSVTPSEAPASKSARLRHAEQNGHGKTKASSGHSEVRTTTAPKTVSTAEVRKRPLDPTIDFDESTPKPEDERILQTAEIKTTTSETILVKTLPGPEEGSWIVETRKVVNTIERVYFPPLPASGRSSHREASMEIDQKVNGSNGIKTEAIDTSMHSAAPPLDEISRLLSMATAPRASTKPPQELLDALASLPATTKQ